MIFIPKGYKRALTIVDDVSYIGFYDNEGNLEGFCELLNQNGFESALKRITEYEFPKYIPQNVEELQKHCAKIYHLIKDAFAIKQYASTLMIANPESESAKKIYSIATECEKAVEEYAFAWASLHPLWMGHEYEGMKYHGKNPYNFSHSPEPYMFERDQMAIAFGQKDFEVGHVLKGRGSKTAYDVYEKDKKVWDKFKEMEKVKQ